MEHNDPAQSMRERLQKYLLEIIDDRRPGAAAKVVGSVLWALSQVYGAAVRARLGLYSLGIFRRRSLDCLTISVGNITVGGSGKTPLVEALAASLSEHGRKVAILSRGYKSKHPRRTRKADAASASPPTVVSDGENVLLDPIHAGDEPYLLATNLRKVPVLVDKNRVRAGEYAVSRLGADTLILDDGFQYLTIGHRLDFVLVDSANPFGNGHLLPRGILREPLSRLKRAHCFFLTKTTDVSLQTIKEKLRAIKPNAAIIETVHQPLYFEDVTSGRRHSPEFARGKTVYVLSAIARPESFERAIERLGSHIRKRVRFTDHHRFSPQEVERILAEASADGVDCILTTQKDAVRLPRLESTPVPILFLRVVVRITRGAADFAECVSKICSTSGDLPRGSSQRRCARNPEG